MERRSRLLRRSAVALTLSIIVFAGWVAADASAQGRGGAGGLSGSIVVWDNGTVNATEAAVTKAFEKVYPNIHVKIQHQSLGSYNAVARAAVASHSGPDVLLTYPVWLFSYLNGLTPLTQYVTPQQRQQLTGWQGASTGVSDKGTPYGVPWGDQSIVWYYNKALFAKAGLNPNRPPRTWAQLLADAKALKAHGITPMSAGFSDGYYLEFFEDPFSTQFMSNSLLDRWAAHPSWADPGMAKGLAYALKLYHDGYMTPNSLGLTLFPQAVNEFASGKAAMFVGESANNTNWNQFKPMGSRLGAMLTPTLPGSLHPQPHIVVSTAYYWSMTKWSKNPKAAYAWISYITSPAAQSLGVTLNGLMPNNRAVKLTTHNALAKEIFAWTKAAPSYWGPQDVIQAAPEAVIDQDVPLVLQGKMSLDAMLSAAQQAQQTKVPPIPGA